MHASTGERFLGCSTDLKRRGRAREGLLLPGIDLFVFDWLRLEEPHPETGRFETLYDSCDGRKLNGPNDLVFDETGGFWFTDLGKTRDRDQDRGVVYYAKADGSLIKEAIFPLERPNGIGLSPDERTLYVVETPTARCWSFRLAGPGDIASANGCGRPLHTVSMGRSRRSTAMRLCAAIVANGSTWNASLVSGERHPSISQMIASKRGWVVGNGANAVEVMLDGSRAIGIGHGDATAAHAA